MGTENGSHARRMYVLLPQASAGCKARTAIIQTSWTGCVVCEDLPDGYRTRSHPGANDQSVTRTGHDALADEIGRSVVAEAYSAIGEVIRVSARGVKPSIGPQFGDRVAVGSQPRTHGRQVQYGRVHRVFLEGERVVLPQLTSCQLARVGLPVRACTSRTGCAFGTLGRGGNAEVRGDQRYGESLHGEFAGLFKLRVGDYRIIYALTGSDALMLRIRHRGKATNGLRQKRLGRRPCWTARRGESPLEGRPWLLHGAVTS